MINVINFILRNSLIIGLGIFAYFVLNSAYALVS